MQIKRIWDKQLTVEHNNWFLANELLKMHGHSRCKASTVQLGNWFVIIHQLETIIEQTQRVCFNLLPSSAETMHYPGISRAIPVHLIFCFLKTPNIHHKKTFTYQEKMPRLCPKWMSCALNRNNKVQHTTPKTESLILCYTAMLSTNTIATY